MEDKTLEEIAKELTSFPGRIKGEIFRNHLEYIKFKEGEKGVEKLEKKMAEMGAPIKMKEINPTSWQSEGLSTLIIVTAKEIFNWSEEDIFEWGRSRTKISFIVKILIQSIFSIKRLVKDAPKHWERNFNFGSIEADLNEERKRLLLRVRGYKTHPVVCAFHTGYFKGMVELCIKSESINIRETKCIYKGDPYHEYLVTWN